MNQTYYCQTQSYISSHKKDIIRYISDTVDFKLLEEKCKEYNIINQTIAKGFEQIASSEEK